MALFRAVLLVASLGCSAVVAVPQEAPSSQPVSFSVLKAHTESKQASLQVPPSTPTWNLNAPIIESTQAHLDVPTAYTVQTEILQTSLEVPHGVTTQGHVPDLRTRSTHTQPQPAPGTAEHIYTAPRNGEHVNTPPEVTTLYAAGTPVVTGPAGTAIIIHGTPVAAGLPAAEIKGTTYSLAGGTLWVNGRPERLPRPTPSAPSPDKPPNAPNPTHARPGAIDQPGDHPEATHAQSKPKGEATKPAAKSTGQKPGDKPSAANTNGMTWTGPGLTTETGISNAGVHLLPGLSLAMICLLATLV